MLAAGDRVAVIAPASQMAIEKCDLVDRGIALLESWGLRVEARPPAARYLYLAGTDAERAGHLNAALADPEIRAIFCLRGGYGSARLLPLIDRTIAPVPKFIVGYSDITTLHIALPQIFPAIAPVHGPNLAAAQLLDDTAEAEANRRALHAALFAAERETVHPVRFVRAGAAQGPIVGGCLSLVAATLGTPFALRTEGSILFLEENGEAPYRIDRMITQMKLAGMFDRVRGVLFGSLRNCGDPHHDVDDVLRDLFGGAGFPVATGFPSGHGDANVAFRVGDAAVLDPASGLARIGAAA